MSEEHLIASTVKTLCRGMRYPNCDIRAVSYTHLDEAKDPFYVLLLGTDGRPGEDTYRADSIILARIDPCLLYTSRCV